MAKPVEVRGEERPDVKIVARGGERYRERLPAELRLVEADKALESLQEAVETARQRLLLFTESGIGRRSAEAERTVRQMYERVTATKEERQRATEAGQEAAIQTLLEVPITEIINGLQSSNPQMKELAVRAGLIGDAKEDLRNLGAQYENKAKVQAEEDARQVEEWERQVKSGAIEAMEQKAREKIHAGGRLSEEEAVSPEVRDWAKVLLGNPIAFKGFVVACEARMAAVMEREYLYDFNKDLDKRRSRRRGVIESKMPEIFGGPETEPESREKVREHLRNLAEIGEKGDFRFDFEQLEKLHGLEIDMESLKETVKMLGEVAGLLNFVIEEGVGDRSKKEKEASLAELREAKALLYALAAEAYVEEDLARGMYLFVEAEAGAGLKPEEPRFKYREGRMPTWRADLVNPADVWEVVKPVERSPEEIMRERVEKATLYKGGKWRERKAA